MFAIIVALTLIGIAVLHDCAHAQCLACPYAEPQVYPAQPPPPPFYRQPIPAPEYPAAPVYTPQSAVPVPPPSEVYQPTRPCVQVCYHSGICTYSCP